MWFTCTSHVRSKRKRLKAEQHCANSWTRLFGLRCDRWNFVGKERREAHTAKLAPVHCALVKSDRPSLDSLMQSLLRSLQTGGVNHWRLHQSGSARFCFAMQILGVCLPVLFWSFPFFGLLSLSLWTGTPDKLCYWLTNSVTGTWISKCFAQHFISPVRLSSSSKRFSSFGE